MKVFAAALAARRLLPHELRTPPHTVAHMASALGAQRRPGGARLAPEVNRILFVRNLPYKISAEDMYDLFGKYGAIRQVRIGTAKETKGTAYVVYDDIHDARNACEHLSGFNLLGRYLIVLYWQPHRTARRSTERQRSELDALRAKLTAA